MHDIEKLIENVSEGISDPLDVYATLKEFEQRIKSAINTVEPYAIEEAANYGKSFDLHGYSFTVRNGAKRFDFKNIEEWTNQKESLVNIESKYKAAWESFQKGLQPVDENGEILELPKVTYSKDSLTVKTKNLNN